MPWRMTDRPRHGLRRPQALFALSGAILLGLVLIAMSASRNRVISYSSVDSLLQRAPTLGGPWTIFEPTCQSDPTLAHCPRAGSVRKPSAPRPDGLGALGLGIILGGLILATAGWLLLVARRSRGTPELHAKEVASAYEKSVRRSPANPRETVIAAFAAVEDVLTAVGLDRLPSEGPESYLKRALPRAMRMSPSRATLLKLYAVARYSEHSIDGASAERAKIAAAELGRGVRTQFVSAPPSPSDPGLQLE